MTDLFSPRIRKFFKFKGAYSHKRTRRLSTKQHRAFHTKQFAQRQGFKKIVPHKHKYFSPKKNKIAWEEYSDRPKSKRKVVFKSL